MGSNQRGSSPRCNSGLPLRIDVLALEVDLIERLMRDEIAALFLEEGT